MANLSRYSRRNVETYTDPPPAQTPGACAGHAIGLVVVEPFPSGQVLLSLTDTHGIDAGDIPALAMLLIAACLAV